MSTRATITVSDENDSFDIYQHHDGYPEGPHGLVRHIAMAKRLAWDLPRFEAADFAAAVVAVLKDRGGSTDLTKDADVHGDRDFHYRIAARRENCVTRVLLTITRPSYERGRSDVQVFTGEIREAVAKFNAVSDPKDQPREWQILGDLEGALCRAEEEIAALCGNRPDEDTEKVLEDIYDASRAVCLVRYHLDRNDPWTILTRLEGALERLRDSGQPVQVAALPSVDVKLVMDAHRRFQRD